ncbi:molybdate ABC transporter substrate-binding protein [Entomomonas sp. E2T0]|uniref:molybdate ABC transporter substrate-binding protein n=1 Tax=Entomomonas sp. E2T0 TaxID=2930213 RepID=UPI0022283F33|nr:molybdate ABC transporter substrate-binding protein [Entomomonas sp. E2T0]UYZ83641.1 molybdate ABC transporter substrate-binding protein [Entomomonas sp. E2T0]
MISKNLTKKLLASVIGLSFASIVQAEEIVVSAAASLNNAFKEIATQFEKKHPADKILFNFAASGTLLQQIAKGAPVDVFASADQETMDQAEQQQLINNETRKDFTQNTLVLISPIASSLTIKELTDLNLDTVKRIAVGNPANVPAGRYTQEALEQTGQWQSLKDRFIYTQNVRQALDYVARDEVDVGFVYGSDAAIMQDKVKILLTASLKTAVTYPIAQIKESKHNQLANNFIEFVLSTEGQQILAKYGFSSINQ